MRYRNFLLWLAISLCLTNLFSEAAEARKRRHREHSRRSTYRKQHRTSQKIYGGLILLEVPPPTPSQIAQLLALVADPAERMIAADFHENPCTLFEDNITVIEPHRVVCRNRIYKLDETTPQFWWFETDRTTGKVERQTLGNIPPEGHVLTRHILDGTPVERGLYLATSEQ